MLEITINRDDVLLHGKFYSSQGNGPFPTLLLLQGSPGNPNDVLNLGHALVEKGYNILTFNYSGTHGSDGLSSFENTQLDIHEAYNFLLHPENVIKYKIDVDRIYVGGWSHGGGMGLTYAANNSKVKAVFAIAGADLGEIMRKYLRDNKYKKMVDNYIEQMKLPNSPMRAAPGSSPKEVVEQKIDMSPFDLQLSAPALSNRHVLLVGGWDDLNVKIDNHMLPLYRKLKSEKALNVTIHAFQDDHNFTKVRDKLAELIFNWMNKVQFTNE